MFCNKYVLLSVLYICIYMYIYDIAPQPLLGWVVSLRHVISLALSQACYFGSLSTLVWHCGFLLMVFCPQAGSYWGSDKFICCHDSHFRICTALMRPQRPKHFCMQFIYNFFFNLIFFNLSFILTPFFPINISLLAALVWGQTVVVPSGNCGKSRGHGCVADPKLKQDG